MPRRRARRDDFPVPGARGHSYYPGAKEAPVEPATATPTPTDTASRTILIVDDNAALGSALRQILVNAGYAAQAFVTGLAALKHAGEHRPDAAIIDVHLPDINGLVLTQRLRDLLGPETPLIILSGDTSMETINSLPHVGATYFFPKPVQGAQLVERLREWVG
jgi:DNA-binding response OmpR family regulator